MYLSEEQKMLQEMVCDFAQNRIKPLAAVIDEEERFPAELISEMSELGLLGIPFPEEYGGAGMGMLSYTIALEEIAKVCGSTALTLMSHISLGANLIYTFGNEQQKHTYLSDLCSGKSLGALALTEAQCGSDAGALQTACEDKGDYYLLNGTKTWVTNGSHGQVINVCAVTDQEKGARGISCFIVEKTFSGFGIGDREHKLGVRGADTVELRFTNTKIPKENLLGKLNEGYRQILTNLDGARIAMGAIAIGLAEGAYDCTSKYVKQRKAFGKTLADFQATRFKLSDMYTQIQAAKHLVYDAALRMDAGESHRREASMAKLFSSEMATKVCSQAIQLYGGYGYMRDYPVERMFRDSRLCEIGGGTSEIQRLVIARTLLREN
jgi:butyryl-CoA dehydrogenase